jgi:DNA-binding Lrp family transcriptional regulator
MVEAIVLMNFLGGTAQNMEWYKSVKKQLLVIPGVVEVFGVLGGYDMVARIRAKDLDELTTIVKDDRFLSIYLCSDSDAAIGQWNKERA